MFLICSKAKDETLGKYTASMGGLVIMYAEEQNEVKLMLNFGVSWFGWNLKDVSMRNRVKRKDKTVQDE